MTRTLSTRIFFLTMVLISFGLVMIFSTSSLYARELFGDDYHFFKRQLSNFGIGLVLQLLAMKYDYRRYKKHSWLIFLIAVGLLAAIFVPGIGKHVGGAKRWIHIGPVNFQPSEYVKLAVVIFLAYYLDKRKEGIKSFWTGLIPALAIVGGISALIIKQPDFGTMVLLGAVSLIMLFVGGARFGYLIALVLSVLPVLYWMVWNSPYRRKRITIFLNPSLDPLGSGYQVMQSLIALGSGGLLGVGLGQSRQKLFYLPEAHTDFIFSIIGEEIGFIGAAGVIFIFGYLFWTGFQVVMNTKDPFGRYLALGIVSLLALQAMIHIGVVTSALPPKGIPLPFISFGGSSLVMNMVSIGILINIAKSQPFVQWRKKRKLNVF